MLERFPIDRSLKDTFGMPYVHVLARHFRDPRRSLLEVGHDLSGIFWRLCPFCYKINETSHHLGFAHTNAGFAVNSQ